MNLSSDGPETVVRNVLTRLVHLMKEVTAKNNPKGVFDITCAKLLVNQPDYMELISGIESFKDINLDLLKSRKEKVCFYGNLQNLMFLHMCLDNIDKTTSNTKNLSGKIFCEMCEMEKILCMNLFTYNIGQLGKVRYCNYSIFLNFSAKMSLIYFEFKTQDTYTIHIPHEFSFSLFDLKFALIRHGLPTPLEFGDILKSRISGKYQKFATKHSVIWLKIIFTYV